LSRPHGGHWAIRYRPIPIQDLDEKDALHPRAGLDGSPLDAEQTHETPEKKVLRGLMDQLSRQDKELLYCLFWDCKSTRQIGVETGVDHTTIMRRRDRIIDKLRKELNAA